MTRLLRQLEHPLSLALLRWAISVVIAIGLISCVAKGANSPKDPYLAAPGSASATGSAAGTSEQSSGASAAGASSGDDAPIVARTPLTGFGETLITVRTSNGDLQWCLLLAETPAQRSRGLMEVTDLGGYDGMLFRYDADATEAYWMRNTPMPLSIAFVSRTGAVVSTVDMAPCADRPDCPSYPAAAPYRTAIEVPQGGLDRLGIVGGNTVVDDKRGCG